MGEMMTQATFASRLARYADAFPMSDHAEDLVTLVQRRVSDSLACVLGAYGAGPVEAGVAYASSIPGSAGVFGTAYKTSPECAAFANGIMVRFLHYNDGYMGREPGHPSDNIPGCLAVAQVEKASGLELISAILL